VCLQESGVPLLSHSVQLKIVLGELAYKLLHVFGCVVSVPSMEAGKLWLPSPIAHPGCGVAPASVFYTPDVHLVSAHPISGHNKVKLQQVGDRAFVVLLGDRSSINTASST